MLVESSNVKEFEDYVMEIYDQNDNNSVKICVVSYYPGTDNFLIIPDKNIDMLNYKPPDDPIQPRYVHATYLKLYFNKTQLQTFIKYYNQILKLEFNSHYQLTFKSTTDSKKGYIEIVMLENTVLSNLLDQSFIDSVCY